MPPAPRATRMSMSKDDVAAFLTGSWDTSMAHERRRASMVGYVPGSIDKCPPMWGSHRYIKGTTIEKPPPTADGSDAAIDMAWHPLNILLLFLPLGVFAWFRHWGSFYVFWFNFFAMVPLAKILGDATEELAASLKNDMIAGLLNATLGNAVEMVITVQTLRAGMFEVVKATLLGSVLSNLLLVLGMSFLCGGLVTNKGTKKVKDEEAPAPSALQESPTSVQQEDGLLQQQSGLESLDMALCTSGVWDAEEKIQTFSVMGALVNTSMLLISCMSFCLITVFRSVTYNGDEKSYAMDTLLPLSRISSILIMLSYVAYIIFQLVTHKEAMNPGGAEDEGGDDGGHMPILKCTLVLCVTTLAVAFSSELLVAAIEGVTEHAKMSDRFIGIILLPIVGNACEHAAAVRFAMQDKLGLSVSIAVGSSTQIALFVVPFSVLAGWALGQGMDLNFGTLNTSLITLSVIVVLSMVVDGQSNWLQGYLLCSMYATIAVMYWYLPDEASTA